MHSSHSRSAFAVFVMTALILFSALSACTTTEPRASRALYDLGYPAPMAELAAKPAAKLPPLSIPEIGAPSWMDNPRMYYRLGYDNPLEAHTYSQARWTMSPARLFLQRLKARINEAGGAALGAGEGGPDTLQLRIDADDFSHVFTAPGVSMARIVMRVSVLNDRKLVAQRTFTHTAPAPSPDAGGGARALANATDAMSADMIAWLSTLPPNR